MAMPCCGKNCTANLFVVMPQRMNEMLLKSRELRHGQSPRRSRWHLGLLLSFTATPKNRTLPSAPVWSARPAPGLPIRQTQHHCNAINKGSTYYRASQPRHDQRIANVLSLY